MRTRTILQGFLTVSLALALTTPAVVYGYGANQRDSYNNFTSGQFFTQSDRDLVKRVRERIRENRDVEAYAENIQIKANQGTVMLTGSVKNERDKAEIGATAQHTLGVMEVENLLRTS